MRKKRTSNALKGIASCMICAWSLCACGNVAEDSSDRKVMEESKAAEYEALFDEIEAITPYKSLSNTNPIIQLEWAQTKEFTPAGRPLNDYFDKLYLSYEIGVTKPDREIFDRMVLDSGIRPEETLFVDDGKNNIVVGQELGFHTYQPLNGEDWRGRLDEILSKS